MQHGKAWTNNTNNTIQYWTALQNNMNNDSHHVPVANSINPKNAGPFEVRISGTENLRPVYTTGPAVHGRGGQ